MSEPKNAEQLVTVSVRIPRDTHLACSVAAARAEKSLNKWLVDAAEKASATSNAGALIQELSNRQIMDERVLNEWKFAIADLLRFAIHNARDEVSELGEHVEKMLGILESEEAARDIRAHKKEDPEVAHHRV